MRAVPPFLAGRVEILPGTPYPVYRLAIIAVGLAVALFLYLLIARTRLGMLIRAGASNRVMLGALGVNIAALYTFVFALGAALAALAGAMAGPIFTVESGMGESVLISAFVVIVIGGIGSIRGAFVAALLVGIVDAMGRAFLRPLLALVTSARRGGQRRPGAGLDADLHPDGGGAVRPAAGPVSAAAAMRRRAGGPGRDRRPRHCRARLPGGAGAGAAARRDRSASRSTSRSSRA